MFTKAGDRKHELLLMKLRIEGASREHLWRMETINAEADIAESKATHKPMKSFGIQLLDKATDTGWSAWIVVPVFWMFSLLDWVRGMIRPVITTAMVAFYMFYRWQAILLMDEVSEDGSLTRAIVYSWGEHDWAMLFMVLAYWFGDRTRQKMMKRHGGGNL